MQSRVTIGVLLAISAAGAQSFPDNGDWKQVLDRYVTAEHLVDYKGLRDRDRETLDRYVGQLAKPWPKLGEDARQAALINAYNALTVQWIVRNYPVESIWRTKKPFTEARHMLDGKSVSLDDIETGLRKMDPRVHAALVCAARSCPPLRREPYAADQVGRQLDDNMRQWLSMPDRNQFDVASRTAGISKIFDWYGKDFGGPDGVRKVLAKYAPPGAGPMFGDGKPVKIKYQRYRWGLNDNSDLGTRYSDLNFYVDKLKN